MSVDTFSQAILNGKPSALKMAKTLLTTPTLIYTGQYDGFLQLPFSVPLEVETHQLEGTAEVSESLVIAKNKKTFVSDNVAPGSWTWSLSGYIPGLSGVEITNFFTPFVTLHTELLKTAFKRGYVMIFKDIDAQIYRRVVIKSLKISEKSECKNKKPFMMTLKEINVMDDILSTITETASKAIPGIGSSLGSAISFGVSTTAVGTVNLIQALLK